MLSVPASVQTSVWWRILGKTATWLLPVPTLAQQVCFVVSLAQAGHRLILTHIHVFALSIWRPTFLHTHKQYTVPWVDCLKGKLCWWYILWNRKDRIKNNCSWIFSKVFAFWRTFECEFHHLVYHGLANWPMRMARQSAWPSEGFGSGLTMGLTKEWKIQRETGGSRSRKARR